MADVGSFIAGSVVGKMVLDKTGWNQSIASIDKDKKGLLQTAEKIGAGFAAADKTMTVMGAAIVGTFGAMIKTTANAGDQIAKLSRKLGISTELLSGYKLAAELGGSSLEGFATGMRRLASNAVDADQGLVTSVRAFDALGISVKDNEGKMKDLEVLLLEVADRFSKMEDGTVKAALAQDLFGRSGLEMIPMLNEGREGMKRHREEAERLGMVFSREAAQACENFNDRMNELKKGLGGATKELTMQLMPAVTDFIIKGKEIVIKIREWVAAHPELAKQIGSIVLKFGGLMAVLGPAALIISKLIGGFIGLGKGIVSAITLVSKLSGAMSLSVGAWMAAAGAIAYYIIKLREKAAAEEYAELATKRDAERTEEFRKKLEGIAEAAGLSKAQFADLTEKYHGNINAMALAIKRGQEGKELQEAMNKVGAERVKQIEEERKKHAELGSEFDKFIPKLSDLTEKQKTFGEVMDEWGIKTIKKKAEEITRLLGYENELDSLLAKGMITVEDYGRAMTKLNEELKELGASTLKQVLPPARDMTAILRQAIPVFKDISYQTKTFDELLEAAADRMGYSSMTVIRELYNIRREFLATIGIMLPEWPAFAEAGERATTDIGGAFDGLYNDIASGWGNTIQKYLEGGLTFKNFTQELWDSIKISFFRMIGEMTADTVLGTFKSFFKKTSDAASDAVSSTASSIGKIVSGIGTGLATLITTLATAIATAATTLAAAAPEIAIVAALGLAIYAGFLEIKGLMSKIFGSGGGGDKASAWIHESRNFLADIRNMMDWVNKSLDTIKGILWERFDWLIGSVNDIRYQFGPQFDTANGYLRTIAETLSNLPGYQHGGIALRPQLAQVGEVPEAIVPLNQLSGIGGRPMNFNFTFNVAAMDARSFEEYLKTKGRAAITEIVNQAGKNGYVTLPLYAVRG